VMIIFFCNMDSTFRSSDLILLLFFFFNLCITQRFGRFGIKIWLENY
jgi:hypothetical protein